MSADREVLSVRSAQSEELEDAFRLLFQHAPASEREYRIQRAIDLVRGGEFNPEGVLVARGEAGLEGAMLCLPAPGASGLVWPPQSSKWSRASLVEDRLVQHACAILRRGGAKLVQAMLPDNESDMWHILERNGFAHVTRLWYMRCDLPAATERSNALPRLTVQTYEDADRSLFHETLLSTYEGTLDCPEVNGVRSIEEIISGHQGQGTFEPCRWWLAWQEEKPVAVLLLAALPENNCWDVAYLGVAPEHRKRGVGRQLMSLALKEAAAAGVPQLTLAVDVRNGPARALYRSIGFELFDAREVYLAIF